MQVLDGVHHLAVVLVSGHCFKIFFQANNKQIKKFIKNRFRSKRKNKGNK